MRKIYTKEVPHGAEEVDVDFFLCRLKQRHSLEHLQSNERERINRFQEAAQKSIQRCIEKLQPFYEQGSLTAANFWISEQRFNQSHPPDPMYHYSLTNLQPSKSKVRADLAVAALEPWIRLLVVSFELMEHADDILWRYYAHAVAVVTKLENESKLDRSLLGEVNGLKNLTPERLELHKKIIERYQSNVSQIDIVKELKTNKSTVSRVIKKSQAGNQNEIAYNEEFGFCRLKQQHSRGHLPTNEREKIAALQIGAKKTIQKCTKKLQPFYEQGSLTAANFWISEQRFNQSYPFVHRDHYAIAYYVKPIQSKVRGELAVAALEPWIRLLVVSFELMEHADDILWRYYAHAGAAVTKLEGASKLKVSLQGSVNGKKNRESRVDPELKEKIIQNYQRGIKQSSIAEDLNTSNAKVSRVISEEKRKNT
jgi:phage tail protein X